VLFSLALYTSIYNADAGAFLEPTYFREEMISMGGASPDSPAWGLKNLVYGFSALWTTDDVQEQQDTLENGTGQEDACVISGESGVGGACGVSTHLRNDNDGPLSARLKAKIMSIPDFDNENEE
jgi:hypothetical protein